MKQSPPATALLRRLTTTYEREFRADRQAADELVESGLSERCPIGIRLTAAGVAEQRKSIQAEP